MNSYAHGLHFDGFVFVVTSLLTGIAATNISKQAS